MKVFVAVVLCLVSCVSARDLFASRSQMLDKRGFKPGTEARLAIWRSLVESSLSDLCIHARGAHEAHMAAFEDGSDPAPTDNSEVDVEALKRVLQDLVAEKRRTRRAAGHTQEEEEAFWEEVGKRAEQLGEHIGTLCVSYYEMIYFVITATMGGGEA